MGCLSWTVKYVERFSLLPAIQANVFWKILGFMNLPKSFLCEMCLFYNVYYCWITWNQKCVDKMLRILFCLAASLNISIMFSFDEKQHIQFPGCKVIFKSTISEANDRKEILTPIWFKYCHFTVELLKVKVLIIYCKIHNKLQLSNVVSQWNAFVSSFDSNANTFTLFKRTKIWWLLVLQRIIVKLQIKEKHWKI